MAEEEKSLIAPVVQLRKVDRTSDGEAELMPLEVGLGQIQGVSLKCIRVQVLRPEVIVDASMQPVGSALGVEQELGAAGAAVLGREIGFDRKLLEHVRRRSGIGDGVARRIIAGRSVDRELVLPVVQSGDRVDISVVHLGCAGDDLEKLAGVASFQRYGIQKD